LSINEALLAKAEQLIPSMIETRVEPVRLVDVHEDAQAVQGWSARAAGDAGAIKTGAYGKGDSFVLDFGDHLVGYLRLSVRPFGSPPDAPLRLKLIFGETPCEIGEPFESYNGWLSSSWLQEEILTVDVLPAELRLPRRYCFRYVKVAVVDTSPKYKVSFPDVYCIAVTSGDPSNIRPLPEHYPEDIAAMDRIGIKTLQDCMQTVFEDGPKRDRRLWIGDLRLQALANYETFRNDDLVKRCLYLFGSLLLEDGAVGACIFEKPAPHVDDTRLYDYSLFFVPTLLDYVEATNDRQTLEELWPVARSQLEIGLRRLDERGVVRDDATWWCFIDWHEELNKQAPAQAVLLYCLKRGLKLARKMRDGAAEAWIAAGIDEVTRATLAHLWDEERGFFVSGERRQVSWASQIWMVLAEVFGPEDNAKLLRRLAEEPEAVPMTTPYMYHHYIEALIASGEPEVALKQMRRYWGGMVEDGADTFWELYNPDDKRMSPYGSFLINSYCHAWSCTPTYFIRKHFKDMF